MSYKVVRPFFDKDDNHKPYKKGDSFESDDDKRISFLIDKGFIEGKKPKKKQEKKTESPKKKK